jgi:hypothetical protein
MNHFPGLVTRPSGLHIQISCRTYFGNSNAIQSGQGHDSPGRRQLCAPSTPSLWPSPTPGSPIPIEAEPQS